MNFIWNPVALLPVISSVAMGGLALLALRHQSSAVARAFAMFAFSVMVWAFGYALELSSATLATALVWANFQYLGILTVPPSMFVLALRLAGKWPKLSFRHGGMLMAMPVATAIILATDPYTDLFRQNPFLGRDMPSVEYLPGPWFWVNLAWSYALILATLVVLGLTIRRGEARERIQSRALLMAMILPLAGNILFVTQILPTRGLDPTPILFSISALILFQAVGRWSFFRLAPVARNSVFEGLSDAVIVLDPDGAVADFNPAAEAFIRSPASVYGARLEDGLVNDLGFALKRDPSIEFNGRSYDIRVSRMTSDSGSHLGTIYVLQDVTEEREANRQLSLAKEAAEAASEARTRFFANMSHELRTPINGILGLSEILTDTELQAEQRNLVRSIQNCSDTLLGLVNDVLDLSRLEEGKMPMKPSATDLDGLLDGTVATYSQLARRRGLDFRLDAAEGPYGSVVVDGTRLRQILDNLLGNALKFTPRGSIELRVRREPVGWYRFEIADTGIGIPAEEHARIFERFEQADSANTRKFGGSGLGLAITQQIVRALGGELTMESTPGVGSVFTVRLPLPSSKASVKDTETDEVPAYRVLVAEDNEVNAMVTLRHLAALGCFADHRPDGLQTVEACRRKEYDVVFLDIQMPVMDGFEACRQIRQMDIPQPRIIGLTASAFEEDRLRGLEVGMDLFLTKPLKREALRAALLRQVASTP